MARAAGPGPGAYMLPPLTGFERHDGSKYRNPQYSFGLKPPLGGKAFGPGPQYELKDMTRFGKPGEPHYTCAPRLTGPSSGARTPGPGAHSPELAPRMKEQRPPEWSMAKRVGLKEYVRSPGPAAYRLPAALGPKVPDKPALAAYSMSYRTGNKEYFRSPGPAQYGPPNLDTYKDRKPVYTCPPRAGMPGDRSRNPGPAAYLPGVGGRKMPEYSFGVRHSEFSPPFISPDDNHPCG